MISANKLPSMLRDIKKEVGMSELSKGIGTKEVARLLDVHKATVIRWADEKKIKCLILGRKRIYNRDEIEGLIKSGGGDPIKQPRKNA